MSSVAVVLPLASNVGEHDYYIGVDSGALLLIDWGIRVDMAIGDFDSCNDYQIDIIRNNSDEFILHDNIKDDTDTALALSVVDYLKYDEIYVYGAFQKRFDHALANFNLLINSRYNIYMIDDYNCAYKLFKGTNLIKKSDYLYISFFSIKATKTSLKGFKYTLLDYELLPRDNLAISNEFTDNEAIVEIDQDIICVMSKDK